MKSHKCHLLLGDLREWSLLIGSEEWSHDFAVRFGQKENDVGISPCIVIFPHVNGISQLIEETKSFPKLFVN